MIDLKKIEKLRTKLLEYTHIDDITNNISFDIEDNYLVVEIGVISSWWGSDVHDFGRKFSEEQGYLEDNIKIQLYKVGY